MAIITSDTFLDTITVSAITEVITVRNRAVLTIRRSLTAGNFPFRIVVESGKIDISSTGVGGVAPIHVRFSASGSLSAVNDGQIIARGGWTNIATGAGTADQVFVMPSIFMGEAPAFVEVETASASNVYNTFINLGLAGVGATLRGLSGVGVSGVGGVSASFGNASESLGRFFEWRPSASAIRFGNGLTGNIPALGAIIRVPDIWMSSSATYTQTQAQRLQLGSANTGYIDMENVNFSDRFWINLLQPQTVKFTNVGSFAGPLISECYDVTLSKFHVAPDRTGVVLIEGLNLRNISFKNPMTDCYITTWGDDAVDLQYIDPWTATGCNFVVIAKKSTADYSIVALNCNNINLINNNFIGGGLSFSTSNVISISGANYADQCNGLSATTNAYDIFLLASCTDVLIDRVRLLSPISIPRTGVLNTGVYSSNVIMKDVDFDFRNSTGVLLTTNSFSQNVTVARAYCGNPRTGVIADANYSFNIKMKNVVTTGALRALNSQSFNSYFQGISFASNAAAYPAVYDRSWDLGYNSLNALTGKLSLIFTPQINRNYYQSISGTPFFNNNGLFSMPTSGDIAEFTTDWKILGVSSFNNIAVGTSAAPVFITNVVREYATKASSATEWSPYKFLVLSALTGEYFDPSEGFYFKTKFTCTATNANNSISGLYIDCKVNPFINYPIGFVSLIVQNVVSGSQIYIKNNTTNEVIANTSSTGTLDYFDVPYDYDGTNVPITIRIRKSSSTPKYLPFETTATYDKNGAIVYVSQILDTFI
jgi:hypothetical protein